MENASKALLMAAGILIGATIIISVLAVVVFYSSLKKYESGNNIAMKE